MSSELVPVRVGECLCPGAPHPDGDFVYLRPKLGLAAGIAVQRLVVHANQADQALSVAEFTGILAEGYLLHGIAAWNLQTERGPVPVTHATIRDHLLDDFERAAPAADAADDLYVATVIAPLVKKALASSPATSSNGSTSVTRNGSPKRRKPSRRSSTSTTPTAATATTTE